MSRDVVTTLDRRTPSGDLRQFLDPLNPGVYFDHGAARLYGIDEVLEMEAKRRGRRLGDDEFQLVATDGGLIFCRSSICFAIAARWRDLTLHRPTGRNDESGRVELPVDWPTHGQLTFTVSARLGTNIYRRWLHLREQDDKRAHMTGGHGLEVARHTDPSNPVTVVLDDDARRAMMGELAPDSSSEIDVDELTVVDDLQAVSDLAANAPGDNRSMAVDVLDEPAPASGADEINVADSDDFAPGDIDSGDIDSGDIDSGGIDANDFDAGDSESGDGDQKGITQKGMAIEPAGPAFGRDKPAADPVTAQSAGGRLKLPGAWTEPGLELTGGETLFVVPERGTADDPETVTALSTVDPAGLDLRLDHAFALDVSTSGEHRPTDVMPSVDGFERGDSLAAAVETSSGDDSRAVAHGEEPSTGMIDDELEIDPNQTVRQVVGRRPVDAEDLLHFDADDELDGGDDGVGRGPGANGEVGRLVDGDLASGDLTDDGAVKDSVFAVERPVIPPAGLPKADSGGVGPTDADGPGVRDSDPGLGSFKRPGISDLRSMRSKSAPFAGGIGTSSSVDGDTTLAEIWHRNRVSIVAGLSLIVLLIVALSSLLNGDDDGSAVEAGGENEITIPERSGSISLPTEDPAESTSTTEPRAPLVIEGLTTVGDGVGSATGAAGSNESSPEGGVSTEGQDGDVAICHSNYGGCVPVAADVDCVGDGDGPAFLSEPVVVFGEDVYDLDTDDDREACELGQPLATPPRG